MSKWEKFKKDEINVRCDSKEEQNEFLTLAQDNGILFRSGEKPLDEGAIPFDDEVLVFDYGWDKTGMTCYTESDIQPQYPIISFEEFKNMED